ncbi:MAG: ATP-grasp domain-containing protein, partial [Bacteroidota bacterium]
NTTDVEAVKVLATAIHADIVYSVSSDVNIRTATAVSEALHLPVLASSNFIDLFHYKDRLRQFLNDHNISTVEYRKVANTNQAKDWNAFPCVVKPVDSQGQRGVSLVADKSEFEQTLNAALKSSSSNTAIIEEYLKGVEFSTNMIVQNGKVLINEFTERYVHGTHLFGLPKGHAIPCRNIDRDTVMKAAKMTEQLVEKLQIKNAVLYIQMVATEQGPKIIEVAPRLDGCHIWRLLLHARSYDLRAYAINCLIGKDAGEALPCNIPNQPEYTLMFNQMPTGETFSIEKNPVPKSTVYKEYRYKDGEKVQPINGKLEVVGYYVYKD